MLSQLAGERCSILNVPDRDVGHACVDGLNASVLQKLHHPLQEEVL